MTFLRGAYERISWKELIELAKVEFSRLKYVQCIESANLYSIHFFHFFQNNEFKHCKKWCIKDQINVYPPIPHQDPAAAAAWGQCGAGGPAHGAPPRPPGPAFTAACGVLHILHRITGQGMFLICQFVTYLVYMTRYPFCQSFGKCFWTLHDSNE